MDGRALGIATLVASGGGRGQERDSTDPAPPRSGQVDRDWQQIYEQATSAQKTRYTELMRVDPIAGMAYLEGIALREESVDHRPDG